MTAGSRCAAADTSGIASPGLVTSRIGVVAALGGALQALDVLSQDPELHLVTDHGSQVTTQLTWFERLRVGLSDW